LTGQTLSDREAIVTMAQVEKEDCVSVDNASNTLGISRATLYSYMNLLGVQRYRFPFDRRTYILKDEVERIREFMQGIRS